MSLFSLHDNVLTSLNSYLPPPEHHLELAKQNQEASSFTIQTRSSSRVVISGDAGDN